MPHEPREIEDLDLIEVPFKFRGKRYVLCEATEPAVVRYRAEQFRGLRPGDDGKMVADLEKVPQVYEAQMNLVGACVYEMNGDNAPKPEPIGDAIRAWPHRHVVRLFGELEQISGLTEGDAAKNSPSATADTSA